MPPAASFLSMRKCRNMSAGRAPTAPVGTRTCASGADACDGCAIGAAAASGCSHDCVPDARCGDGSVGDGSVGEACVERDASVPKLSVLLMELRDLDDVGLHRAERAEQLALLRRRHLELVEGL